MSSCRATNANELDALRAELREWRSGKRRVFWRTRWDAKSSDTIDWTYKSEALRVKRVGYHLTRVTVGPVKKKEAG